MPRKFRRFIPHLIVMLASIIAYFFYDSRTNHHRNNQEYTTKQHQAENSQEQSSQNSNCNPPKELLSGKKYANSGCLVIQNGEILVVSRKEKTRKKQGENSQKNTKNANHEKEKRTVKSAIPGGRKNQDELAPCTAQRRTLELTGIEVVATKKLFTAKNGFTVFLCEAKKPIPHSQKFHGSEVLLVNPAKITNYKYPEQLAEIQKYIAE